MALRPGYKQTAVGVIPETWTPTNLGSFVSLQRGHDLTSRERRNGDIPVMGSAGPNGFHDTALAKAPGVLLGRSGASFGQAHYCETPFWPHNTALYVTDFQGNDPLYTFYFLQSLDFTRHNSGGAQQSLNRNFIYPIPVAVPPIQDQRAIAAALSDLDALITGLDQLIAKKRDIKQGAMQQLLTRQTRLPGFVGLWDAKQIASFSAFVTKGATPTTYGFNWVDDGILFLRSECVSEAGLDLTQSMFISEAAHATLLRGEVKAGDILITITGNVGRVVHLASDFGVANINQHIARIRIIDPNVSSQYVFHWLSQANVRANFATIATGQAYPQISLKQVRETIVPLPPFPEQIAIAAALSDMDDEITIIEARRDKARDLKQGMMRELLTGRISLI